MNIQPAFERLSPDAQGLIERLVLMIVELDVEKRNAYRDYELCYESIHRLGEALGHQSCARPVSASVVMREFIDEVAALTGHNPNWSRW